MRDASNQAPGTGSPSAPSRGPARTLRMACAGALSVTGLLLAGCGSSSSGTAAASAAPAAPTASRQLADVAVVRPKIGQVQLPQGHPRHKHVVVTQHAKTVQRYAPARVTQGNPTQRAAGGTGGSTANDENPAAAGSRADAGGRPSTVGQPNPCVLVSRTQAETFTGKVVTVKEAPLGPTCLYVEAGVKAPVTVAVQRQSFSSLKLHMKQRTALTIGHHQAVCGVYGVPITYVSLPGSRVLSVSASCPVGEKFAAAAMTRLGY